MTSEEMAKEFIETWNLEYIDGALIKLLDQVYQEGYEKGLNDMKRLKLQSKGEAK